MDVTMINTKACSIIILENHLQLEYVRSLYFNFHIEKPKQNSTSVSTAQCVVCKVYFSAQPNNFKLILNFQKYYPI